MTDTVFVRLLQEDARDSRLQEAISFCNNGKRSSCLYLVDPRSFANIPGSPFAYWVSESCRKLFTSLRPLEGNGREVRVGDHPGDGFRFLRLSWEVPLPSTLEWRNYQKGGDFSPFYYDIHLVADWDAARQTYRGFSGRPGRASERPSNYQYFFKPGITWPRRSQRGLSVRVLPSGCVFADKGPVVFGDNKDLLALLGLLNSAAFKGLLSLQMAFGSYETGAMQRTVVPGLSAATKGELATLARKAFNIKKTMDSSQETSHAFTHPALLQCEGESLMDRIEKWRESLGQYTEQLVEYQRRLDDLSFDLYGITGSDRTSIEEIVGIAQSSSAEDSVENQESGDQEEEGDDSTANSAIPSDLTAQLLSYSVGVLFGRWDITTLANKRKDNDPDLFAPLPACAPGRLQRDGLPATNSVADYPIRILWDGILPDDPDHPEDVIRRIREVVELIWKEHADSVEEEMCNILAVKQLRDYFRRAGVGGFWNDHVYRYSRSRRSAPNYWLLQSQSANYALWLYYPRLDKDILFKALVNHVEPKIRLETARFEALRKQTGATGQSGKESKKIAKDFERQEDYLAELRDFEDKLRRAANFHLKPDLNDGVVLNIAPLYELVPWKEAANYWRELLEGKYEWSSIGKQLRQKGLVR